jgi:hypothetical protein
MPEAGEKRIALTAHLSLGAYYVITTIQPQHRLRTGKALPIGNLHYIFKNQKPPKIQRG